MAAPLLPTRIADYFFQAGLTAPTNSDTPTGPANSTEISLDRCRTRQDRDQDHEITAHSLRQNSIRFHTQRTKQVQASHSRAGSGVTDSEDDVPLDVLGPKLRSAHTEVSRAAKKKPSLLGNLLQLSISTTLLRNIGTEEDDDDDDERENGIAQRAGTPVAGRVKRKHPLQYTYETGLLLRYPECDYSDKEKLPDALSMFCFPNGLQFKHSPECPPEATCHSFVVTEENGSKLYGVCLVLYEPIQEPLASQFEEMIESWRVDCVATTDLEYLQHIQSQLASNQERMLKLKSGMTQTAPEDLEDMLADAEEKVALFRERLKEMEHVVPIDIEHVYVPRAVGIVSRWAFFDLFSDWLKEMVRVVRPDDSLIRNGDNFDDEERERKPQSVRVNIPLERLLVNLIHEIPLPPPGRVEVKISVGRFNLFCSRPAVNSIQALQNVGEYITNSLRRSNNSTFPFLDSSRSTHFFAACLSPTSHYSMLTVACESLCLLLYPFSWQYHYIPILPASGIQLLQASFPYIVGVHKDYFYKQEELEPEWRTDVTIVDLDTNKIECDSLPPQFPPRDRRKLLARLLKYSGQQSQNNQSVAVEESRPLGVPITVAAAYPLGVHALRTAVSRRWLVAAELESELGDGDGDDDVSRRKKSAEFSGEMAASVQSSMTANEPASFQTMALSRPQSNAGSVVPRASGGSFDNLRAAMSKIKMPFTMGRQGSPVVEKTATMDDDEDDSIDDTEAVSRPRAQLVQLSKPVSNQSEAIDADARKLYESLKRDEDQNASIMKAIHAISNSQTYASSIADDQSFNGPAKSLSPTTATKPRPNYAMSTGSSMTTAPTTYYDPSVAASTSFTIQRNQSISASVLAEDGQGKQRTSKPKPTLHEGHAFQSFSLAEPANLEDKNRDPANVSGTELVQSPSSEILTSVTELGGSDDRRPSRRASFMNTLRASKSIPSLRPSQAVSGATSSATTSNTAVGQTKSPASSENVLSVSTKLDAAGSRKPSSAGRSGGPGVMMAWKGDSNAKPEDNLTCRICLESLNSCEDASALKCQYCKATIHTSCLPLVEGSPCVTFFNEKKIQYSFFKVFTSLLKNYRAFLVVPEKLKQAKLEEAEKGGAFASGTSATIVGLDLVPDDWFKKAEFLASVDRESRTYLTHLVETQNFVQFTLERIELPESNYEILFFEESIKAKLNRSKLKFSKETTPFLKDGAYSIRATISALPPNMDGLDPSKTYSMTLFPVTLDKTLLKPPRNVNPLVTEADQNMMRSHTNDLVNRTRLNHTTQHRRKQDFSKWVRMKLKTLQRPESRIQHAETLTEEERQRLFDEQMQGVRECLSHRESVHLASQTNAELEMAIEELHRNQFLLIDMTEAEIVDVSDQDEFRSINNRLVNIITLYKEHLFVLEHPESPLFNLRPASGRSNSNRSTKPNTVSRESSTILPANPTEANVPLRSTNISVTVRSRSESLRKPSNIHSPTSATGRLGASPNPSQPSSTRGIRSISSAGASPDRSAGGSVVQMDTKEADEFPSQLLNVTANSQHARKKSDAPSVTSAISPPNPRPRSESITKPRKRNSSSSAGSSFRSNSENRDGTCAVAEEEDYRVGSTHAAAPGGAVIAPPATGSASPSIASACTSEGSAPVTSIDHADASLEQHQEGRQSKSESMGSPQTTSKISRRISSASSRRTSSIRTASMLGNSAFRRTSSHQELPQQLRQQSEEAPALNLNEEMERSHARLVSRFSLSQNNLNPAASLNHVGVSSSLRKLSVAESIDSMLKAAEMGSMGMGAALPKVGEMEADTGITSSEMSSMDRMSPSRGE
ncbi:hypothetical protein HDU80_011325 [Chytriomyces hyalinus]|nr:hypothetical protein HDU80_011325 [Chytriomyces hyalinus]